MTARHVNAKHVNVIGAGVAGLCVSAELAVAGLAARNSFSTVCTLSSAIAAGLATELGHNDAARAAHDLSAAANPHRATLCLGAGQRPAHRFHTFRGALS